MKFKNDNRIIFKYFSKNQQVRTCLIHDKFKENKLIKM